MKKCIIAPDSFKGSMSAIEICEIAQETIVKFFPDCEVKTIPVADGGEGTVDSFLHATGGEKVEITVNNLFMEPVKTYYARIGDMAVIEMASAAGLPMAEGRENPAITTTYGVGEQIRHAIKNGAKEILLGLGGSGTNDGGCGCAAAMGVIFKDEDGKEFVPTGSTLSRIATFDISGAMSLLEGCKLTAMCDIDNPMHGPKGAAYIFGPQKGADEKMVLELDKQLVYLDNKIQEVLGISMTNYPGAGAAGAFGAGTVAFLGAELKPGIQAVLDTVNFDELLTGADFVFTGEGKLDSQSLRGKVVIGIAQRARVKNVPVIAVVGDVSDDGYEAYNMGISAIFSINRLAIPFSEAKLRSKKDYKATFEDIVRLIKAVKIN
ncbi:MAG: glycerate kinase [Acetivibrionales bacterium]|jgi:glycerate kinase